MSSRIDQERPRIVHVDVREEEKAAQPRKRSNIGSSIETSIEQTSEKVNWIAENRFGFATLTGLLMVPSQFLGTKAQRSGQIIERAALNAGFKIERFDLPIDDNTSLHGVIYYPENWNQADETQCVLYHNPNAITVAGYFGGKSLNWTPAEILKLAKCPLVMYDYRGTGLSSENGSCSSMQFRPTYESIVVDGEAALRFALKRFDMVKIVGSSLGGGVATISLDRHLRKNPDDWIKVRLYNHDSFTNTARVVMPNWPKIADWTGWALGGYLDAAAPMKNLILKGIPVTVLCHRKDPVIPKGARMAEFVATLPKSRNVSVIESPLKEHATLSEDMARRLVRI